MGGWAWGWVMIQVTPDLLSISGPEQGPCWGLHGAVALDLHGHVQHQSLHRDGRHGTTGFLLLSLFCQVLPQTRSFTVHLTNRFKDVLLHSKFSFQKDVSFQSLKLTSSVNASRLERGSFCLVSISACLSSPRIFLKLIFNSISLPRATP